MNEAIVEQSKKEKWRIRMGEGNKVIRGCSVIVSVVLLDCVSS